MRCCWTCILVIFSCSGITSLSGQIVDDTANQAEAVKQLEDDSPTVIPEDFDWESYIAYHPDVYNSGVVTEQDAIEHYVEFGATEGLLHHRLNVVLRYTACTGLINQIYSHIAAISLGIMLGAELVLPPAAFRDSFANYFSVFKERNEMTWTPTPLADLLDEDAIISHWGPKGVSMHKAEGVLPFPDLTQPHTAYVPYPSSLAPEDCSARMKGVYASSQDMEDLVNQAQKAVVEAAEKLEGATPGRRVDTIVLDLPCSFFMLHTASHKQLMGAVAKSLKWAPRILELAEKVISGIRSNRPSFNSLHLRLEKDARDWTEIMGGAQAIWERYVGAMQTAGMQADSDLYIASGLLSYGADSELVEKVAALKDAQLCGEAHWKEMYLSPSELDGLNPEQKALVDFLVLKQGHIFVGFGASTFSYYLHELRILEGIPKSRSVLVDASEIRTDDLFARAAVLS